MVELYFQPSIGLHGTVLKAQGQPYLYIYLLTLNRIGMVLLYLDLLAAVLYILPHSVGNSNVFPYRSDLSSNEIVGLFTDVLHGSVTSKGRVLLQH
jgi:hypothetical protein